MKVIEYSSKYEEDVKSLLVQLQEHLVHIDTDDILVMKENYREEYFAFVRNELSVKNGSIYLAVDNGRAIGLVIGICDSIDEEDKLVNRCPQRGIVSELVVDLNYRRLGVGKMLLEAIEKDLKGKGCEYIRISVFAPNISASAFYEAMGYHPIMTEVSKKI